MQLGYLLILAGIFLILVGTLFSFNKTTKSSFRGGGVVLIGPIPVVFGSDWKIAVMMMALAITIILLWWLLLR